MKETVTVTVVLRLNPAARARYTRTQGPARNVLMCATGPGSSGQHTYNLRLSIS